MCIWRSPTALRFGDKFLPQRIERLKQFQFRDIRTKSASELLVHTEEEITGRVYRRVGQAVAPTR